MAKIMAALVLLVGCGSSYSTPYFTSTPTSTSTSTSTEPTLKLEDYLTWCSVSVNGGAASTAATQTLSVPQGTMVPLAATPASSVFVWGYWVGTDGDTSASHDTVQAAMVTMDKSKVVQACCPFASAPSTPCAAPTP